jgi:hypothetical protein
LIAETYVVVTNISYFVNNFCALVGLTENVVVFGQIFVTFYSNNNNSIQFNSIQFNSGLLMCRVNSQMANYRNSTT